MFRQARQFGPGWNDIKTRPKHPAYCTDSRSINARLFHRQAVWTKPLFQNRDVRLSLLRGCNNGSPT